MARSKEETESQPNYTHWALFAAWTFEQATALSLDINPEIAQSAECPAAPLAQYKKRLDVVNSHRYFSEWFPKSGCVEPHLFVAWARNYGLDFPAALANAVAVVHGKDEEWQQIWKRVSEIKRRDQRIAELEAENAELKQAVDNVLYSNGSTSNGERALVPKEQQSLLKLVLGMAIDKYHYKPNSGNSSATGRIVASLEKYEIRLGEGTVLSWLRTAAEQIDFVAPE